MVNVAPTDSVFRSQGLRLNFVDWGNPGAPALVLLHGARDHARSWDNLARALQHAFHVMAPDMRGHGDSDWSPDGAYDIPYLLCDLATFMREHVQGQATIIAHSYGAAVALRHAGIHAGSVRRLVAIEGLRGVTGGETETADMVAARWQEWLQARISDRPPRRHPSLAEAAAHMHMRNPGFDADWVAHLTRHGTRRDETGRFGWKFDPRVQRETPCDMTDDELHLLWGRIDCPVLLAYGRESWARDPREDGRMSHFRDARLEMFEGAGHWLHHQRLDEFLAVLRGFL